MGLCSYVAGHPHYDQQLGPFPSSSPAWPPTPPLPHSLSPMSHYAVEGWTAVFTGNRVSWPGVPSPVWKAVAANVSVTVGTSGSKQASGVRQTQAPVELCDFEKSIAPLSSSGASSVT